MLFAVRTHRRLAPRMAALAEEAAQRLGRDRVVLAVDERRGDVDVPGVRKLSLTPELYRRMGLHTTSDVMWRCGDYALYALLQAHPTATSVLMVDGDVRFNHSDPVSMLMAAERADVDYAAFRLREARPDWGHDPPAALHYDAPRYAQLFAVVYARAPVIRRLHAERIRHSLAWSGGSDAEWMNDESFCANEVARGGFVSSSAEEIWPTPAGREAPGWRPLLLEEEVAARPMDGTVYLQVGDAQAFLNQFGGRPPTEALAVLRAHGYEIADDGRLQEDSADGPTLR